MLEQVIHLCFNVFCHFMSQKKKLDPWTQCFWYIMHLWGLGFMWKRENFRLCMLEFDVREIFKVRRLQLLELLNQRSLLWILITGIENLLAVFCRMNLRWSHHFVASYLRFHHFWKRNARFSANLAPPCSTLRWKSWPSSWISSACWAAGRESIRWCAEQS